MDNAIINYKYTISHIGVNLFRHLHKFIISYRDMIDSGLILVPKFIMLQITHRQHENGCMSLTERHRGII